MCPAIAESKENKSATNASRERLRDSLAIAAERGLLSGSRNAIIRGRMPTLLVAQAKKKTGIHSDSKLLEAALASLVVADDYAEWLLAQSGTISADLDLEF